MVDKIDYNKIKVKQVNDIKKIIEKVVNCNIEYYKNKEYAKPFLKM